MTRLRKDPFLPGNGRTRLFLAGVAVTAFFILLFAVKPRILTDLDRKVYDFFLTAAPLPQASSLPLIIDIDDKSLNQYGQWPWPRYRIAQLLETLHRKGAAVVSFDMVFSEPDRTSLLRLAEEMRRDLDLVVRFSQIPEAFLDHDQILAQALKLGPTVLGFSFLFDEGLKKSPCPGRIPKIPVLMEPNAIQGGSFPFRANSSVCNLPVLSQAASSQGFFNIRPDPDGILRRAPLVVEYGGSLYPNLTIATLLASGKFKTAMVRLDSGGAASLKLDDLTIPLDEHGNLWVRFRGPSGCIPHFSAADILGNTVPAESLKGRMIFVGSTAAGLKDIHATPFDPVFPGVEMHAHVLDNIVVGDFIKRFRWLTGLEVMLLAFFGIASAAIFVFIGPLFSVGFTAAGSLILGIAAAACLGSKGVYFSPLYPFLNLMTNFTSLSLLKYYLEEKKVHAKTLELSLVQEVTLETIANVAETRDPETGGHIKRTQHYVRALAEHLKHHPEYKKMLTDDAIEILFRSAPLHDLGKVGVPDNILLKPGKLTEEEFERMKLHTTYAYDIIAAAEDRLGKSSFLQIARELAYTHQEKWDGSGYPRGLKGNEIPISGRLMAVADVYDALINRRPYKDSMQHEEAVKIITDGRGTHFDPALVDAFLEIEDQFKKIASRFIDPEIHQEELR